MTPATFVPLHCRKKLLLITALFIWLSSIFVFAQDNQSPNQWYPFAFSKNPSESSIMNIGAAVLDGPSGKHGFVTTKDSQFIFADGTPIRFWGTNLCFNANFPDKKEAEWLARRIAFFGFNAVRLHHMDFYFEPKGIFEDTSPAYKNPQNKETSRLSREQLERLDYLIFQLKERGIYINLNLLVARHFTEADGITDAQALGMAAKPASMFDQKLIALQKKYAQDLLSHKNKYTGLTYADDPAIALVEITNENSILGSWRDNKLNGSFFGFEKNALPDFYAQKLDELWNDWLKEKYGTIEKLRESWGISAHSAQPTAQSPETEDHRPQTTDHRPQTIDHRPSTENARGQVIATSPQLGGRNNLSAQEFHFSRPLHKTRMLYPEQEQKDILEFYIGLEKEYFSEMHTFLKKECGVQIPITGIGGIRSPEDTNAQDGLDFIDAHAYWDHPKFPRKAWDNNDFEMTSRSMLADHDQGIVGRITKTQAEVLQRLSASDPKPFTLTEWNHCYPNPFAYETPVWIAAQAIQKNWAGLFQFAFSHGWKVSPVPDDLRGYFDTIANPQQLILSAIGGLLYIKGVNVTETRDPKGALLLDSPVLQGAIGNIQNIPLALGPLQITTAANAACLLLSMDNLPVEKSKKLILVTLGEIKNKNSGWKKDGTFDWGDAPTLLKKIPARITIPMTSSIKIFRLDAQGLREKELQERIESNEQTFTTNDFPSPWYEVVVEKR